MYSRYPTSSKRSKTVQQRGVEIHSPVRVVNPEIVAARKRRRRGPTRKKMIVYVLHLSGVSNCVFFILSLIKYGLSDAVLR